MNIAELIDEGWAVVPIIKGTKRPDDHDWLNKTYTAADFRPGDNIGAKTGAPSSNRVDIDCDTKEALIAARELLPHTVTHGRASKPRSHYWFVCPEADSYQYKDLDGTMLLEIRSTGLQTVIPPSVHKSGEAVAWDSDRPKRMISLSKDELRSVVNAVAIATLFARHWPSGSRHVAATHVGGFLARLGFDAQMAEHVVTAAARAAGDEEVSDRARAARDSVEKHLKGEKTTGAPSIAEHFDKGKEICDRIYTWLGRDDDNVIDQMNAKHFVARVGKGMVVGTEEPDGLILQNFSDFEQMYINQFAPGKAKMKLGKYWLEHRGRRTYRTVMFAPPHSHLTVQDGDYNLWRGFAVQPSQDSHPEKACARYLEHIAVVIASGDDHHYQFVLDLLADAVQKPGRPVGKALALRSPQGYGKSVFVEAFGALFGRHFTIVASREQLAGRFNAHLSGKVVVFADEAVWGGNRQDEGTLKRLVTQNTFNIERKGVDISAEPNYMHLFLATNNKFVWPAGVQERRGVVLDLVRKMDRDYFNKLFAEVESPGFSEALLAVLLQHKVDYSRLRNGLDTEALREQQDYAADPAQQWWRLVLNDGKFSPKDEKWPEFVSTDWMYERFTEEMGSIRGAGYTHRGTKTQLINRIREYLPGDVQTVTKRVLTNTASFGPPHWVKMPQRVLPLPTLAECREEFDRVLGTKYHWPDVTVPEEDETELEGM